MYKIGIEDLAANALIEMMSEDEPKRFVSYEELESYGAEVVNFLNTKDKKAVLILSRESTNAMFRNYSDIFKETVSDDQLGIQLKTNITIEELITKFRKYLAWDVLLAFENKQTVAKLKGGKDMNLKNWLENNCADEGLLQDWYQSSVDESNPVWTDEHISELMNDFYVVPKDSISKVCKNEIDVLVEGGYIRATAAQDENYPGIDVEFVPNKPQEDALSFPRVLVEKPLESDNLRAVIWANPNDEDYSDEIKFTSIS